MSYDIQQASVQHRPGRYTHFINSPFVLTVVIAAIVLVLDVVTPLGFAIWLVQVALVWFASLWASTRQTWAISAICSSFLVLGFWFSPRTGPVQWVAVSNLLLALAATAVITHTGIRRKAAEDARKKAEEIAAHAEAARRHEEMRSMILDALAHELQTPLTSIRAGIGAMLASCTDPDQREWLTIMDEESDRLGSALADTIHMARIDAGCVELDKQVHTIDDLVHTALEKEETEAPNLKIDLPAGLPAVDVDARLMRLVIRQVVGNALKYSLPGVPIGLSARGGNNELIVSVTDRGPGISTEEQAHIFDRYYRGQHGSAHTTGMGLGLPIARQVIEAHGGRMWVQSRLGEGTTVSFTLPLAAEF